MSIGALTQLAAIGAQDSNFLSDDPSNTIFKESTDKITNFAKSVHTMIPKGNANWGTTFKFTIEKEGDMLNSMYVVIKLPEIKSNIFNSDLLDSNYYFRWSDYIGNLIIDNVKLYIGGQLIDEQTGEFQQIYTDLYDNDCNKLCLLGMDDILTIPRNIVSNDIIVESTNLYIPLKFWFCNNIKKALPLIALQYSNVEVEVTLKKWEECYILLKKDADTDLFINVKGNMENGMYTISEQSLDSVSLDCNFFYLDYVERKKAAQSEYKILINQTQHIKYSLGNSNNIDLNFNHPVKEIFFNISIDYFKELGEGFNFKNKHEFMPLIIYNYLLSKHIPLEDYFYKGYRHILSEARILINTHPRVDWKDWKYYYYLQNYENYRNILEHYVYLYSFSSDVYSDMPMGSLNFSRIDNSNLQIRINKQSIPTNFIPDKYKYLYKEEHFKINIYAINYNYIIIKGGIAGVEFSN